METRSTTDNSGMVYHEDQASLIHGLEERVATLERALRYLIDHKEHPDTGGRTPFKRPVFVKVDANYRMGLVRLISDSHELGGPGYRAGKGRTHRIHIGEGAWIGAGATVLGGATIGSGSVVAAGAIVNTDVPENSVYGGIPARLIRRIEDGVQ